MYRRNWRHHQLENYCFWNHQQHRREFFRISGASTQKHRFSQQVCSSTFCIEAQETRDSGASIFLCVFSEKKNMKEKREFQSDFSFENHLFFSSTESEKVFRKNSQQKKMEKWIYSSERPAYHIPSLNHQTTLS
jgi:hypothetical protein